MRSIFTEMELNRVLRRSNMEQILFHICSRF